MKQIQSVRLTFTEGSSDKEYKIHLIEDKDKYSVNFEYGRRNGTLKSGTKTSTPVSQEEAEKIFNKILKEKTSEGYVLDGAAKKVMSVWYSNADTHLYFDGDECVGATSMNDADWRHEYFNPIMEKMGLEVIDIDDLNKKQMASAKKKYSDYLAKEDED